LSDPFEACIWAIATSAFWGLMHFGEATVRSCTAFKPARHLKRSDALFGQDLDSKDYARLDLLTAKTARPRRSNTSSSSNKALCAPSTPSRT
ncbi:hypothetical protein OH77DRAFT_1415895, partial [Trametes cingulata]